MSHKRHLNIHITGQVQGVTFRASARTLAEGLGVTGFARNQPDGSILIEAEGYPEALQEFKMWCEDGPRRAKITAIHMETGGLQHFTDFQIK